MSIKTDTCISRLLDVCEKTRRQCHDIEQDYAAFRAKQFSSLFPPKQICSTPVSSVKRQRSHSVSVQPIFNSSLSPSNSPSLFNLSSTSIFQSHLSELKSHIHSLTNECTTLNTRVNQSEAEKSYFLDRITQLERQRRDEHDSFQTELNHYRKLFDKSTDETFSSFISSPPEHDLSLYDEVLLQSQSPPCSYEPTNYKELFARVYEKLQIK